MIKLSLDLIKGSDFIHTFNLWVCLGVAIVQK